MCGWRIPVKGLEIPRDCRTFNPNSSGRAKNTSLGEGEEKALEIHTQQGLPAKGIPPPLSWEYWECQKVSAIPGWPPIWCLFPRVNCLNSLLHGEAEFFILFSLKWHKYALHQLFLNIFCFLQFYFHQVKFCALHHKCCIVVHVFSPTTWESEAGVSLWILS